MLKVEGGPRSPMPAARQDRRRTSRAVLVFAVAYGLVCALVAMPKGYFTATDLAASPAAIAR